MPRSRIPTETLFLFVVFWVATTGCLTAKGKGSAGLKAETHSVTNVPVASIAHREKWNPSFWWGNADDPVPPDWYRPDDPERAQKWYFRNPLHNFDFYVIGIADKPFIRTGRFPSTVFNPNGGWNWAVCSYRWIRLPFVSYWHGDFKFYLGWRERGNFGLKLTF